jgi:hypothetical protein
LCTFDEEDYKIHCGGTDIPNQDESETTNTSVAESTAGDRGMLEEGGETAA